MVSKEVEFLVGIAPVLVNLHEGLEIDGLSKELLEGLASLGCHLLERLTLVPDDDAFLRITLHVNHGIDMDVMFVFLETLHTHLY